MEVIGTPQENCTAIVKAIALDMKLTCRNCDMTYRTEEDMESLKILTIFPGAHERIADVNVSRAADPAKLVLDMQCGCGHVGSTTLRPNPLVMT